MTFTYTGNIDNYNRALDALRILEEIEKISAHSEYGGYVSVEGICAVICKRMFGHYAYWEYWHRTGRHSGYRVTRKLSTDAEDATCQKVVDRMAAKGILKISASGKMAKLTVTMEDYALANGWRIDN